jgi:FAD/FMN-containing dehydrogenase
MARWIPRRRWVRLLLVLVILGVALVARPTFQLLRTAICDRDERKPLPRDTVDDASRLNATLVSQVWDMPADDELAERKLRELLAHAKQNKLRIAIAGAKHSMGGQSLFPGGIQINMLPYHHLELDESENLLSVQAGALWSDVIPFLDNRGRSVAVMQSNSSFSVGGSLSVNCHGWQSAKPPIASTVKSFRLMLADGSIVRCSRDENAELFGLALGGYGLFGIILDAQLFVVPNERYRLHQYVTKSPEFIRTWDGHMNDKPDVQMAMGRLGVTRDSFLSEALLYTFTREQGVPPLLPSKPNAAREELARIVFRSSVDSDYGKELRWSIERDLAKRLAGENFTRNELLAEPADILANRTANTTDILQEYFVPRENLWKFIERMQAIIPNAGANLLNVTVREVQADPDTFLRYADQEMFSLVLLFNQDRTDSADEKMTSMTNDLIDAVLASGGRYYLPYRLPATPEQFDRAYPQAKKFFELKRHYDPDELFQNQLYVKYGQN